MSGLAPADDAVAHTNVEAAGNPEAGRTGGGAYDTLT